MDSSFKYLAKTDLGMLARRIGIDRIIDIHKRLDIVCNPRKSARLSQVIQPTRLEFVEMLVWTLTHSWKPQADPTKFPHQRYVSGGFIRDYILNGRHPNDIDFGIYKNESLGDQQTHGIAQYAGSFKAQFMKDWPNIVMDCQPYTLKTPKKSCLLWCQCPGTPTADLSTESHLDGVLLDGNCRSMKDSLTASDVDLMMIDETGLSLKYDLIFPHSTLDMAIANAVNGKFVMYPHIENISTQFTGDELARGSTLERIARFEGRKSWKCFNTPEWWPGLQKEPIYDLLMCLKLQELGKAIQYVDGGVTMVGTDLDEIPDPALRGRIESYATLEYFGMEASLISQRQKFLKTCVHTGQQYEPTPERLISVIFTQAYTIDAHCTLKDGSAHMLALLYLLPNTMINAEKTLTKCLKDYQARVGKPLSDDGRLHSKSTWNPPCIEIGAVKVVHEQPTTGQLQIVRATVMKYPKAFPLEVGFTPTKYPNPEVPSVEQSLTPQIKNQLGWSGKTKQLTIPSIPATTGDGSGLSGWFGFNTPVPAGTFHGPAVPAVPAVPAEAEADPVEDTLEYLIQKMIEDGHIKLNEQATEAEYKPFDLYFKRKITPQERQMINQKIQEKRKNYQIQQDLLTARKQRKAVLDQRVEKGKAEETRQETEYEKFIREWEADPDKLIVKDFNEFSKEMYPVKRRLDQLRHTLSYTDNVMQKSVMQNEITQLEKKLSKEDELQLQKYINQAKLSNLKFYHRCLLTVENQKRIKKGMKAYERDPTLGDGFPFQRGVVRGPNTALAQLIANEPNNDEVNKFFIYVGENEEREKRGQRRLGPLEIPPETNTPRAEMALHEIEDFKKKMEKQENDRLDEIIKRMDELQTERNEINRTRYPSQEQSQRLKEISKIFESLIVDDHERKLVKGRIVYIQQHVNPNYRPVLPVKPQWGGSYKMKKTKQNKQNKKIKQNKSKRLRKLTHKLHRF